MENKELLERIGINPKVMVGKPVIKGTRLTVQYILKLLADGFSFADIKKEYDGITDEDITACLLAKKNTYEEKLRILKSIKKGGEEILQDRIENHLNEDLSDFIHELD
ncbi:MAG: DUF433 domain-containing protein [Candidatus Aminicenantes bacterium]|nr:DUF433 domain-containing protein [Candidatus Aminicenantes bacterium]